MITIKESEKTVLDKVLEAGDSIDGKVIKSVITCTYIGNNKKQSKDSPTGMFAKVKFVDGTYLSFNQLSGDKVNISPLRNKVYRSWKDYPNNPVSDMPF